MLVTYYLGAGGGLSGAGSGYGGAGFGAAGSGFVGAGAGPIFDPGGLSARAGPAPEAVAMAAQRLAALARDVDSVRQGLGSVDTQQWRSPAAAVFRDALAGLLTELWAGAQALDTASAALSRYGLALQLSNDAEACASPLARRSETGSAAMGWES